MSYKFVLKKDSSSKDHLLPLYLRISKDRKSVYIGLQVKVDPFFWSDKRQKIVNPDDNGIIINARIEDSILKLEEILSELNQKGTYYDVGLVKRLFTQNASLNFLEYMDSYLKDLRDNSENYGTYINYRTSIKKFKAFIEKNYLSFDQVNTDLLKTYESHLRYKLNNSTNTVYNNMKVVRCIIYRAIDEGLIPVQKNPFSNYKLTKKEVNKDYLSHPELLSIDNLVYNRKNSLEDTRKMFLFSCFTGLRLQDIKSLKWQDVKDGVIKLEENNGEILEFRLINKAMRIINELRAFNECDPDDFVFRNYSNVFINKSLKKIAEEVSLNRKLNFNMARNTFAILAIKKGIRLDVVSKLMRHKNFYSILPYARSTRSDVNYAYGVLNKEFF